MFACSRAGSPNLRSARSFGTGPSISPVGLGAAEGLSVIARGWTSNVRAPCDAGSSTAAKKDCVLPYRMPFTVSTIDCLLDRYFLSILAGFEVADV
ncbi:Hypothetical protein NTJ_04126 [Nesidiocoris tenuis]|uniref:Uncharacterized protein n=1 Tax=Nesidiocoris tenuis TaxID=355587 RepID=A0ABN7AGD9_9HEMI|nr:Hypothetical protein NTJ_04126 [Nesidiocoris tenuis]